MIRQVCRRLRHAPGVAQRAVTTAFAEIGDEVVMPAVITASPGKTVGKDAAFQVFAKRLAHTVLWGVCAARRMRWQARTPLGITNSLVRSFRRGRPSLHSTCTRSCSCSVHVAPL